MTTNLRLCVVIATLIVACSPRPPAPTRASAMVPQGRRMPDGKRWTTSNLKVDVRPSYCYDDNDANCDRYGRLYTWESAQRACRSIGRRWRLPTSEEWRQLARYFGGVVGDSNDGGRSAYEALMIAGKSGFDAVKGGGRTTDGQYARIEAHGFYWTATETDSARAWFYNFGGQRYLNRHSDGDKARAFAVRCIEDTSNDAETPQDR